MVVVVGSIAFNLLFANYSSFGMSSIQRAAHHLGPKAASYIERIQKFPMLGNNATMRGVFQDQPMYPVIQEELRKIKEDRDTLKSTVLDLEDRLQSLETQHKTLAGTVTEMESQQKPLSTVSATPPPAAAVAAAAPPATPAVTVAELKQTTTQPAAPDGAQKAPPPVNTAGRLQTGGGQIQWAKPDDLPAGGRRIFIDLGANCGNSYNALKDSTGSTGYDIAYLWELNPQLVRAYLIPLEKVDPIVRVVPFPAWGNDTNMTFYLDKRDDFLSDEEVVKKYPCTSKRVNTRNTPSDSSTFLADQKFHRAGRPLNVQAIGFPGWFRRQNFSKEDRIHLKVDIEGAECSVLDSFMDEGLLCEVSKVMVEWHARCVCMYVYMHTCIYKNIMVEWHAGCVCMYVCMHTYMCRNIMVEWHARCVCVCVCVYIYAYIHV